MSDALAGACWGAGTALLFFACWKLVAAVYAPDDPYQKGLHTLVLSWGLVVATAVALSTVTLLTGPFLLAAVAVASLGLLVAARLLSRGPRQELAPGLDAGEVAGTDPLPGQAVEWVLAALWLFLLFFWACHTVRDGILEFPHDYDSLMYHIPNVDQWLQARSLYAADAWPWYISNPGNGEVLGLWCVAPFSGDFLIALVNLPAAVILALASGELASLLGLGRVPASVCGVAVTANSVVLRQLTDTRNDVAVAALAVAGLAYALRYARSARQADLVLGGISIGLLAGVKFYALGYVVLAWGVLLAAAVACRGIRAGAKAGLAAAALALCWGGYWYARNWTYLGSPLFPLRLFTADDELAHYYPDVGKTTFLGNGSPELFPLAIAAIGRIAGPLHLAAFYCLPATAGWFLASGLARWGKCPSQARGVGRVLTSCAAVAAGLVLVVTPFAVEDYPGTLNQMKPGYTPVRYGLTFLSLTVILFCVSLGDLTETTARGLKSWQTRKPFFTSKMRWGWLGPLQVVVGWCLVGAPCLLLLVLAGYQVMVCAPTFGGDLTDTVLLAADGVLGGVIVASFYCRLTRGRLLLASLAGTALVAGTAVATGMLSERWHAGFAQFYDQMFATGVFTHLASPDHAPERICALDFQAYPFFGSRRQHHVCQPPGPRSAAEFSDYILSHHVTLVAARFDAALRQNGWGDCQAYIEQNPDRFLPAGEVSGSFTIFRVRSRADAQGQQTGRSP